MLFLTTDRATRRRALAVWDVLCWLVATFAFVGARYDFSLSEVTWSAVAAYATAAGILQLFAGWVTKLYRGRYPVGSFEEIVSLGITTMVLSVMLSSAFMVAFGNFPRGVALTVPVGALVLMGAGRFLLRGLMEQVLFRGNTGAEDVLLYGAGNAGTQLARMLNSDPAAPYRIVGVIDDDPMKRHLRLGGARVLGGGRTLIDAAAARGVSTVILAIPDASVELKRSVCNACEIAGIRLLLLPPVRDMVNGTVQVEQLHELDVTDLLGRSQVNTDLDSISDYLTGKVVLVTGAGGSIGSEIARQVHRFGPQELVLLDRDESGLHGVQLSIYGKGLLDTPDMVLCDIRDREALDEVFHLHRPEVVFHAAALKHLPMLEQYPLEGWKTNVLGTRNVLEMSHKYGVERFVNISTDKAADATSVLGRTKRMAEEMTAWYATQAEGSYLSVRFGNVLGSRGSMVHTFRSQIAAGGPVTVTDPKVTRYFMTIPEACELTIQAGAIGDPGDVLVLDMGEPVLIYDVAQRLIRDSGKNVPIVFTGLRPGEKLHEVLFSALEDSHRTSHPLISQVEVPGLNPAQLGPAPVAASALTTVGPSPDQEPVTAGAAREPDRTHPRGTRVRDRVIAGISSLFAVSLIGIISAAGLYVGSIDKAVADMNRADLLPTAYPGRPAKPAEGVNFLLLGEGGAHRTAFLAHVAANEKTVFLTALDKVSNGLPLDEAVSAERVTGVQIEHTIVVNVPGFIAGVDRIGGVTVNGRWMNGATALNYASTSPDSEQEVVTKVIQKGLQGDPKTFADFVASSAGQVTVDATLSEADIRNISALVPFAGGKSVINCPTLNDRCTGR